jgi:hypothetical protein
MLVPAGHSSHAAMNDSGFQNFPVEIVNDGNALHDTTAKHCTDTQQQSTALAHNSKPLTHNSKALH